MCGNDFQSGVSHRLFAYSEGKNGRVVFGNEELFSGLCRERVFQRLFGETIINQYFTHSVHCIEIARTAVEEIEQRFNLMFHKAERC